VTTSSVTASDVIGYWIDGRQSVGGQRAGEVWDPAAGQVAQTVAYADERVVNQAVGAARNA
jgi:acyl-CoA reductase-like NAD-dependent aldehyde dehydrogenase